MPRLSIIVPTYNRAWCIRRAINSALWQSFEDFELIIVDDGSSDRTFALAKTQDVVVLLHIINRGQGAALKTGTEYALKNGAELIVHFDGAGQFLASDIKNVVEPIKAGIADIVFGSRFLNNPRIFRQDIKPYQKVRGKHSNIPFVKKNVILPLAKFVNRIFFGINFSFNFN